MWNHNLKLSMGSDSNHKLALYDGQASQADIVGQTAQGNTTEAITKYCRDVIPCDMVTFCDKTCLPEWSVQFCDKQEFL